MTYPPHLIDRVRSSVRIEHVIGAYVRLRKSGPNRHMGLCPFHSEKTPSFTVHKEQFYKCFGCGASGDVFTFLMEKEHLSFPEALRELADQSGISLGPDSPAKAEAMRTRQADCAAWWAYVRSRYAERLRMLADMMQRMWSAARTDDTLAAIYAVDERLERWKRICARLADADICFKRYMAAQHHPVVRAGVRLGRPMVARFVQDAAATRIEAKAEELAWTRAVTAMAASMTVTVPDDHGKCDMCGASFPSKAGEFTAYFPRVGKFCGKECWQDHSAYVGAQYGLPEELWMDADPGMRASAVADTETQRRWELLYRKPWSTVLTWSAFEVNGVVVDFDTDEAGTMAMIEAIGKLEAA